MLLVSNINSYVPVRLSKVTGSIHLFKLAGKLTKEDITLYRSTLWDILEIDWKSIILTVNAKVNSTGSVITPFQDKFRVRPLLLHLMLKQGQTWYPWFNV